MITLLTLFLIVLSTLIGATGALLFKISSKTFSFSFKLFITNYYFFMAGFLYFISSIIFLIALKSNNLSILYPLTALSYVWVTVFSIKFLKETMNFYKYFGIIFIILGVCLITYQ